MENQNPVHVFATWKVKEGQIENVLHLLKIVKEESIKEEGNLFYKIHQVNSDLNTVILYEGYTSESAIAEHRNSSYFQEILVAKIVPLLDQREITLTTLLD
ncbi:putative quinol monooxygenase [Flavobacterium sp. MC2016-06]|uniref:putative quinol monooxygenase n=1 Tax=Flavobacterium sp. MC2016-06 TaxID=2676308 RepID=UPI0012BAE4CF|nr:putative quinol monooxygenase [Flavobacterium sp. MC2016-06]MBU3862300.1 antibiotic biosynthesis monooxygenase [Flavobacterium sp. MC2016-06]